MSHEGCCNIPNSIATRLADCNSGYIVNFVIQRLLLVLNFPFLKPIIITNFTKWPMPMNPRWWESQCFQSRKSAVMICTYFLETEWWRAVSECGDSKQLSLMVSWAGRVAELDGWLSSMSGWGWVAELNRWVRTGGWGWVAELNPC